MDLYTHHILWTKCPALIICLFLDGDDVVGGPALCEGREGRDAEDGAPKVPRPCQQGMVAVVKVDLADAHGRGVGVYRELEWFCLFCAFARTQLKPSYLLDEKENNKP